jgi:uncharacterized protein YchJ
VAGVFTRNGFCAAPMQLCQQRLAAGAPIRALLINPGNANAGIGSDGLARAARLRGAGRAAGRGARTGAAVLDRRDHGDAAHRAPRGRPGGRRGGARLPAPGHPPARLRAENPKQKYKREAFELFEQLLDVVKTEVTRVLMTVRIQTEEQVTQAAQALEQQVSQLANVTYTHPNEDGSISQEADRPTAAAAVPKVGRNEPCPCGSGKKYKHCHGRLA